MRPAPDSAPVKRILIVRIGAHGDAIQASSLFPPLKAAGWRITVDTSEEGEAALRHDPHIDTILVSRRDWIKPEAWRDHINHRAHGFNRVVLLNEATEGALLKMPANLDYHWPPAALRRLCAWNYVEYLHVVADVPFERNQQRFYATPNEQAEAARFKARLGGRPLVAWVLSGSAQHKIWPAISRGLVRVLYGSDAHIVAFGSPKDADLAQQLRALGAEFHADENARITWRIGDRSIRQAMALAQVADVVVGPETGILNAVAMEPMAKVVMLSHSTALNLTRDWVNTIAVEPDARRAPCWPCHRMHHDTKHCPQDAATQLSACATSIPTAAVVDPILAALRRAAPA